MSLETAAETRLRLMVPSATLIDWTNQRDSDVAENTSITTAAVEMACAEVKRHLGSTVDETDTFALDISVRLTILRLSNWWNGAFTEGYAAPMRELIASLEKEAEARRQGKNAQHKTPDTLQTQRLDQQYDRQWSDGARSVSLPSDDDT